MGDCTVIDRIEVSRHVTTVSGMCFEACEIHRTAGRSVNHGYVVTDCRKHFVAKTNPANWYNMFEKSN